MYKFKIEVANQVVEINTLHTRPRAISRDYISDKPATISLTTEQEDIDRIRSDYESIYGCCGKNDGFLETIAVLDKLSTEIIDCDVFLMHGAAIAINGSAYLFTAPSGTGKTTHILKWIRNCQGSYIINGDKPFILVQMNEKNGSENKVFVCGSPWAGKENMYTNAIVPLKSIIFMERSDDNRIYDISFMEAFPFLLEQIYRPSDEIKMRKVIKLIQHLRSSVEFYRFHCNNFKYDCFDVAYTALIDNKS